jgi:hypothetical protein
MGGLETAVVKFTFHRFNMSAIEDVEDVEVYMAEPILAWQNTAKGQWVMNHAHNLTYHHQPDARYWGYDVVIRGELSDPRLVTEYLLRWSNLDTQTAG